MEVRRRHHFSKIDQDMLHASFREFDTLVRKYPDSAYAEDARRRMVYLRNKMAEHEYATARYYFRRGAVAGTINRVKFLLENYDGAPIVPDALALMVRAYLSLDLTELADDTLELLRTIDLHKEVAIDNRCTQWFLMNVLKLDLNLCMIGRIGSQKRDA